MYRYDPNGNPIEKTTPNGDVLAYSYDKHNSARRQGRPGGSALRGVGDWLHR